MVDKTTAVATVNMAMLDRAEAESSVDSVMSSIHSLRVYNPAPGTPADPEFAGKFRFIEANTGNESAMEWPLSFTPLSITYSYSGKIYPRDADGNVADKDVFFTTSEFGKFTKRTDTIWLSTKGKGYAFFDKEGFEGMIKSPTLNGSVNHFYESKKDVNGKPYDGSALSRRACIYGQFNGGAYDKEYFRMFISPQHIGVTYDRETQSTIDAADGTLEAAIVEGLPVMNGIRTQNGKKAIQRLAHDQIDVTINITQNAKGNFLPLFSFVGLVAMRGYDNAEDVKYIHELQQEHFRSVFGSMGLSTPVTITGKSATVALRPVVIEDAKAISAPVASVQDMNDTFGDDMPSGEHDISHADF